jgi:hypothetical protein
MIDDTWTHHLSIGNKKKCFFSHYYCLCLDCCYRPLCSIFFALPSHHGEPPRVRLLYACACLGLTAIRRTLTDSGRVLWVKDGIACMHCNRTLAIVRHLSSLPKSNCNNCPVMSPHPQTEAKAKNTAYIYHWLANQPTHSMEPR